MTREEAIRFGEMWLDMNEDSPNSQTYAFFKQALEALKNEPCEDFVSREAVLALAKEECDTAIIPYKRFVKGVNALLPVTPTQSWIPVSEELPKKRDGYYVTLEGTGELEEVTETAIATWIDGWLYSDVDDWELKEVTAWMPLPKSYKGRK